MWSNALKNAVRRGIKSLLVNPPMSCSEWADKFFYLSPESSSIEGKWRTLPYQKALLDWIGNDDIRIVSIQKPARIGYTKILCAAMGYFLHHKKRKILVYQPTDSDARDFVKDEIDPMIRDCNVLKSLLKVDPEKKSIHNTKEHKSFLGASLDIKGGKTGRNYRRMTKDVVLYDELDGFDSNIDGEGSPTALGDTRITTSSFPKSVRGSTPRIKGQSLIELSLSEADLIFFRYLPCPECGFYQILSWEAFDFDPKKPSSVLYSCLDCGKMIGYDQLPAMDASGQWRGENGSYYDESLQVFCDVTGERISTPDHIGVHIWGAYSYFKTWQQIALDFIQANNAVKRGDFNKLKTVVNTVFAEPWEEVGERIDHDQITVEKYSTDILATKILLITIGADVQGDRIECEIVGWGIGEESWSLDYLVIKGDPEQVHVWAHFDEIIAKQWIRADRVKLQAACVCIDSGHKQDAVLNFVKKRRGVYATKGASIAGKPIVSAKPSYVGKNKAPQYLVGTDTAKDVIFARLAFSEPGPGFCHFPDWYDEEYFLQLTSEEKKTKFVKGKKNTRYYKIRARNEALDCRVENLAALRIVNPNFEKLKKRLEKIAEALHLGISHNYIKRRIRARGESV